ncbi:MAG TPA: hypothetical protein VFU62_13425, partial [Hanamia sp.]|nr:hypothetical protein [Hanamia sp.]
MKKNLIIAFICFFFASCKSPEAIPVPQQSLQRVNEMPDLPEPFQIINYKKLALQFDSTVFDFNATGEYWPLVWIDSSKKNFPQNVVGLYTAIGDVRQ